MVPHSDVCPLSSGRCPRVVSLGPAGGEVGLYSRGPLVPLVSICVVVALLWLLVVG